MTPRKFQETQRAKAQRMRAPVLRPRLATFVGLGLVLLCGLSTWGVTPAAATGAPIGTTLVSSVTQDVAHLSPVGFEVVRVPNGGEPPLAAGVWYPTSAEPRDVALESFTQRVAPSGPVKGRALPLIVISHGGGGSYAGHYDTAIALARAGFIVAAVSHAGDTHDDQSKVLMPWRRPVQLSRLIDFMLKDWQQHADIDPQRIGAFGFSNGGFTVLVEAGGIPELGRIDAYCAANPQHDLCTALAKAGSIPLQKRSNHRRRRGSLIGVYAPSQLPRQRSVSPSTGPASRRFKSRCSYGARPRTGINPTPGMRNKSVRRCLDRRSIMSNPWRVTTRSCRHAAPNCASPLRGFASTPRASTGPRFTSA